MSVVGGGGRRGSKVWRRERIEMTDPDLDDVAFLSGVCLWRCERLVDDYIFDTYFGSDPLLFIEPSFPMQSIREMIKKKNCLLLQAAIAVEVDRHVTASLFVRKSVPCASQPSY